MRKFTLSAQAVEDLGVIHEYIARDNPEAAERVIEAAYRVCGLLADHPEMGRARRLPGSRLVGIRSFVISEFPAYVIFYRVQAKVVQIIRVLHGAQDIDSIFDRM